MKRFVLKMPAYHFLERNHYVSISESGDRVQNTNTRVRYFIALDKESQKWKYCDYLKNRNEFYEFILSDTYRFCGVFAGFDQVSRFNP